MIQTLFRHRLREWNPSITKEPPEAPVAAWMREHGARLLSRGIQNRVYALAGEQWVVKEARWDLELDLFRNLTLPLYAEMTESILRQFSFSFLPTLEHIQGQRERYRNAAAYLGYGSNSEDTSLREEQHIIRENLASQIPRLESVYGISLPPTLAGILRGEASRHNFLPEEHLLYGEPFAPENKGRKTFFAVQEFVEGSTLHDVDLRSLPVTQREQLIVFLALMLVMYEEIGLVPDVRPRYLLSEAMEWLEKTDNLIVGERGLMLIDTGWFWERHAPLVRRGLILPERTISNAKRLLLQLLPHEHAD